MGAGSGPPDGTRIIHHGAEELLVEQDPVPQGQITLPVQERTKHTHPLSSFLSHLIDVRRPGESWIQGHPQITSCFDTFDWFPEDFYCSGLDETPSGSREDYRGAPRDINGDSPFTQPPLKIVEV